MSKNIVIQEGGVSKLLAADKLKTDEAGTGSCLWVPEDEVQLTTKTITEDGTYSADDDGYYGYSEVTVHGIGTATGKDSDGDDAVVHTDPETGNLVTDKMPSSISVVQMPSKTVYTVGESINLTGIVVKAYTNSGALWTDSAHPNGIIPISELTYAPTVANNDGGHTSDLDTSPIVQPIKAGGAVLLYKAKSIDGVVIDVPQKGVSISGNGAVYAYFESPIARVLAIAVSASSGGSTIVVENFNDDGTTETRTYPATNSYTHNGKTVYYSAYNSANAASKIGGTYQPYTPATGSQHEAETAWTMLYGDIEGTQAITVSWPRPGDGAVLETSFNITVTGGE